MSCQWGVFTSAYVDGELEPSEVAWFEVHLLGCVVCALELDAFMGIHKVSQSINIIEEHPLDPSKRFEDATRN